MPNEPWSLHLKVLKYRPEALPVVTGPLAPPIEPLQEDAQRALEELLEARTVPVHSVVLVTHLTQWCHILWTIESQDHNIIGLPGIESRKVSW